MHVISSIEDPALIDNIFAHLNTNMPPEYAPLPKTWAPPQAVLFD